MDSTVKNKSMMQPKPIAELLPELCGIVSKDTINAHSVKKQPQTTLQHYKPLTLAELRADLLALKPLSPRRSAQPDASTKRKMWNSSVKVINKTKTRTSDGQMKHNSVRKVLNFQTRAKPQNPRATIMNAETPKFPKPELGAKKSLHIQSKTNIRISGVYHIPETPVVENKLIKNRLIMQNHINKENSSYLSNLNKKKVASPKPFRKPVRLPIPDTPLSNMSFKSNSDASFLQREREINDIEEKTKALTEEPTLENIAEVSPPVSTPFKEYRNVKDFFSHTNENSVLYNDTIMSFNKDSENKENSREESVIVSLCDLLNKATMNTGNTSTELHDLLEVEKQTENNIRMIENAIKTLENIKESQFKSLQYVKRLINEKKVKKTLENKKDTTLVTVVCENEAVKKHISPSRSPILRPSVIKTKSPSYKIPKKNLCLRKKVFCKSMPDVANVQKTPEKNDQALNMYMQMKEKMNFLNTPLVKHRNIQAVDTPTVTSYNLQMQLDKLYNAS
ncbi:unnamed protein product, partial [Brenthis ino]